MTGGPLEPDPLDVFDEVLAQRGNDHPPAPDAQPQTQPRSAEPAAAPRRFADVHAFVREHLAVAWSRAVRDPDSSFRWCPRWAEHPAALDRITALWQAYEALRAEGGTGPSRWWVEHADPSLAALTDPRGQFAQCGPDRHHLPPDLPLAAPVDLDGSAA